MPARLRLLPLRVAPLHLPALWLSPLRLAPRRLAQLRPAALSLAALCLALVRLSQLHLAALHLAPLRLAPRCLAPLRPASPRLAALRPGLALPVALVLAATAVAPALADLPATASESDRLIFAARDFSAAADPAGLAWRLDRQGGPAEGFAPVEDGRLTLSRIPDPADGKPILEMRETGGGRDRVVGRYPVEGMDPVLVYFLETATRNMAMLAGGNPDYIRNRFKDALRSGGVVTQGEGAEGTRVVLSPFAGDPNAAKMKGFEALTLTIELDPRQDAPIRGLAAAAPGTGYSFALTEVSP